MKTKLKTQGIRRKALSFLIKHSNYHLFPWLWALTAVTKYGVEFFWHGDCVIWLWPWRRQPKYGYMKFVSLGFTGNGDFGDAVFPSLKSIDLSWNEFRKECRTYAGAKKIAGNN